MKLISGTLFLPPTQYESRATCIEGYDYPPNSNANKLIDAQGVHILALGDVTLLGNGYIVDPISWTPVFSHEGLTFFPGYASLLFHAGKCRKLIYDLLNTRKSDLTRIKVDSVITVLHYNCKVYGHFLLEIVPKLFVLKDFFETKGLSAPPVAFPTNMPKWIKNYILEIWPKCRFLRFDVLKEYIAADTTFVVTGDDFQAHPDIATKFARFSQPDGTMFKAIKNFAAIAMQLPRMGKDINSEQNNRKVLLIRPEQHQARRHLANFNELKIIAEDRGYEVVEPGAFGSLQRQAVFFSRCSVVLGEFNSALHNTIFCPQGVLIGCMNYINHYQQSIAAVKGHNLNYLIPDEGPSSWDANASYRIPGSKFAQLINDIEKRLPP